MKLALVGFDNTSKSLANEAIKRNHELIGICSKFTAQSTTWGTKKNIPIYSIPGRMLAIPKLNAVLVSSNTEISTPFCSKVLNQGIHIYVSGQRDLNPKQVQALDKILTAGKGKILFESRLENSSPLNSLAVQASSGKIGDTGFIKIHSGWPYPPKKESNKGGVVTHQLAHQFRWLVQHFGPVKKVFAQGVQNSAKRKLDYAMITLTLKKGTLVQIIGSFQTGITPFCRAEICGTNGMVQYDSSDSPIQTHTGSTRSPELGSLVEKNWESFESLIASRTKGTQQAKHFLQAQRIASSALQSMKSGKPISL